MKIGCLYIDLSVINPTEEDHEVLKELDFFCEDYDDDDDFDYEYDYDEDDEVIELWKTGREFYAKDDPDISGFLNEFKKLCYKYNATMSY